MTEALSSKTESLLAPSDKFVEMFKREPSSPSDLAWINGYALARAERIIAEMGSRVETSGDPPPSVPRFICLAKTGECHAVIDQKSGQFVRLVDLRSAQKTEPDEAARLVTSQREPPHCSTCSCGMDKP